MKRRDAIEATALTLGCALVFNNRASAQTVPSQIETGAFSVNPVLLAPEPHSITVVWMTGALSTGWVEFGTDPRLDQKAFSTHDGLIDANQTLHSVTLKNLKPSTKYYYRVVTREIQEFKPYDIILGQALASKPQNFTTLSVDKKRVSFAVLNDLHNHWPSIERNLGFIKDHPCDFIVFNGDIVCDSQNDANVVNFLRAVGRFADHTPIVYVRGNHDVRGSFSRELKDYLSPKGNYYHGFTHGPARFIVMDTGEDKPDSSKVLSGLTDFENYRTEQKCWLAEELKKKEVGDSFFKIFISHIPLYANIGNTCKDGRKKWGPLLNDAGIDLYMAGHTHRPDYVQTGSAGNPAPVSIGGGYKEDNSTITLVEVDEDRINLQILLAGKEIVNQQIRRRL